MNITVWVILYLLPVKRLRSIFNVLFPVSKNICFPRLTRRSYIALWVPLMIFLLTGRTAGAQRTYHDSSVLATHTWYKIAVKDPGVYRVDLAFLHALGITGDAIPSASIRLYGNGGSALPESCSGAVVDDLQENPVQVNDGGDGMLNGSDYLLFFAPGPHRWLRDSATGTFMHLKNLYSDQSFYFLSLFGTGKRIATVAGPAATGPAVTSFDEHYYHELDSINLLGSGKNWYGEDFSAGGANASRSFFIPLPNLLSGSSTLRSGCISRSIGSGSQFSVAVNSTPVLVHTLPAVGSGNLDLFGATSVAGATFTLAGSSARLTYTYQSSAFGAQGWLDWFEVGMRRSLTLAGSDPLLFRDVAGVRTGAAALFSVQGATSSTQVWDVTDPLLPYRLSSQLAGTELRFSNDCSTLHEYVAFTGSFPAPQAIGRVDNQNLHAAAATDMIIVTHPAVYSEAVRLAAYHMQRDHLKVTVVNTAAIYNEFASGSPDPTALRDFVKMFYDRAGNDPSKRPRYLLLFGDASYDYKNRLSGNTSLVPAYESSASIDPLATYTSDDFFGFLDDTGNIGSDATVNLLRIGIGRVPVATAAQARAYVDKVIGYTDTSALGDWRNRITYVADDEDFNLHLQDAESIAATADTVNSAFLPVKIYLDAYPQESTSAGGRYPAVNQEINNGINSGTLIWNYSGHGSARRLAEEVVLDQSIAASWNNAGKLPLFITATCDFAPYDNPGNYSLGEDILLREKTGAIALMTTTRLVFAYSNRILNQNYMRVALQRKPDGGYYSLGEAVQRAKNYTYQTFSDIANNRKFTLLGDPALTLAFPEYQVRTNLVNGRPVGANDTLKALQQYDLAGQVTDQSGSRINDFNGTVRITVYDKALPVSTLANDPESMKASFPVQDHVLFKGTADVRSGEFRYGFVVPKDIDYRFGPGKISYYARGSSRDANGADTRFLVGGSQNPADVTGPVVGAYLNSEAFVNGSETDQNPLLFVKLYDSSGINITGTGIGHDLTAVLDDGKAVYTLNSFYETDPNQYRQGVVRYQLYGLAEGKHRLKIKAWDAANNSAEVGIDFTVVAGKTFSILRAVNYPNPVLAGTRFHFEYDAAVRTMAVSVMIYTPEGQLIKAVKKTINPNGSRFCDVDWDGKDETGAKPHKGVYFYRIIAITDLNTRAVKAGNLLIW